MMNNKLEVAYDIYNPLRKMRHPQAVIIPGEL